MLVFLKPFEMWRCYGLWNGFLSFDVGLLQALSFPVQQEASCRCPCRHVMAGHGTSPHWELQRWKALVCFNFQHMRWLVENLAMVTGLYTLKYSFLCSSYLLEPTFLDTYCQSQVLCVLCFLNSTVFLHHLWTVFRLIVLFAYKTKICLWGLNSTSSCLL